MAPQQVEKIEFAPGNGMVSEASNLLDLVRARGRPGATPAETPKQRSKIPVLAKVAEKGAQAIGNVRCKTEKSRGSASCVAAPLFRRFDPLAQRRGAGFELELGEAGAEASGDDRGRREFPF